MVNNLRPLSGPVDAAGEPQIDDGNIYIFCDTVRTGGSESLACIRGAGHNGDHLFSRLVPLMPVKFAAAVPSSPAQQDIRLMTDFQIVEVLKSRAAHDANNEFGRWIGRLLTAWVTDSPLTDIDAILAERLPPSSPVADVEVIVNGQPVVVTAGTVRAVIEEAIRRSGQIGAPVAQWELRTTEGDIIPHNLTDGTDYELTPGRRLWLNLGPPSSPVADSIHRLIEQWRASADWMMGSTKPDEWQRGGSGYLRKCADELEAALSAPSPSAGAAQKKTTETTKS